MESLEKNYYESPRFWEEGAIEDEANKERIDKTITMIPPGVKSLADIGCGNGIFLNALKDKRPDLKLLGMDRSLEALKYVKVEKTSGDISALPFADGQFDCVSCLEVIEHLPVSVYEQALSELARISNKWLLISVPYNEDLSETFTQCPQCKSIFNANLHLRSFQTQYFTQLFTKAGFTCTQYILAGKSRKYKYHLQYRKLFYPKQFRRWLSPLCPICGYEEDFSVGKGQAAVKEEAVVQHSLLSVLKNIPKLAWPKEDSYYWIIGLFERKTQ